MKVERVINMFIKIVNKNNGATYEIQQGALLTDNFNEEIDTLEISIKHLTSEIDIEPMDRVVVYSSDSNFGKQEIINELAYYTRSFIVNSFQCTQVTAKETKYNYNINLINEIKALEGIAMPSLKITQLKSNPRSISYYLKQYLKEYGTKIRVKNNDVINWASKYSFSDDVLTRFDNVVCPEMQWNSPTLRQVFNDLMMVDDCIPTMQENVIGLLDLSVEKEQINTDNVNYVVKSQSLDDYVDSLKIELKNVMQSNQVGVNNSNEICEYIGFRNDNVSVLNTQNILIQTTNPILEIEQVIMCCPLKYREPITQTPQTKYLYKEIDITFMVYEQKEWQCLSTMYNIGNMLNRLSIDDLGKYQNTSLFYNRYNNTIDGFNSDILTKMFILKQERPLIQLLNYPYAKLYEDEASEVFGATYIPDDSVGWVLDDIKGITFKVKYKTTASSAMNVSRDDVPNNKRCIVDNQTNSYVDAYAQGILEYMKVNRLGNELLTINARYTDFSKIANVGEKYGDSIIFKKELMYYNDYVVANYYATKNYVLRDYFTGVRAKIRSWKIVEGSECLERHDIIKYCLEFDYTAHNEIDSINVANYFLSPFNVRDVKLMNKNVVQFAISANNALPSNIEYYNLDFVTRVSGNSILFTFGLNDNYSVAKYIDTNITDDVGGLPLQYYTYVDSNGENIGGNIYLCDEISQDMPVDGTETTPSAIYSIQAPKPKVAYQKLTGEKILISYSLHKDNSEITRITTQFEFSSNSNDIVIGSAFLKLQKCLRTIEQSESNYRVYLSNTKPNLRNREYLPADMEIQVNKVVSVTNNYITINFTELEFTSNENKYIYITDDKLNVLVGYQLRTQDARLYLNVLRDRNKAVYDTNGNLIESI